MTDNDSEDLVTVAVFQNPPQANLVKNELEAVGIKAYLSGEEAVAMVWQLSDAMGGIKVQVASSDAEDALAFLERGPWREEQDPTAFATSDTLKRLHEEEDDEIEELTDREKDANRLAQTAIFGLVFWPLEVLAFWLLVKVYISSERLEGRPLINAYVGGAIALALFALISAFGFTMMRMIVLSH